MRAIHFDMTPEATIQLRRIEAHEKKTAKEIHSRPTGDGGFEVLLIIAPSHGHYSENIRSCTARIDRSGHIIKGWDYFTDVPVWELVTSISDASDEYDEALAAQDIYQSL